MEEHVEIKREDGQVIHAIHKSTNKTEISTDSPLIIMVHGFPKNQTRQRNFFSLMSEIIRQKGYSTLQFDYAGCDNFSSETQHFSLKQGIEDLRTVYAWAANMGYSELSFVTEGLGAAITVLSEPENTGFCTMLWPAFNFNTILEQQLKTQEQSAALSRDGYILHSGIKIGHALIEDLRTRDITPKLNAFSTPTLILHGEKDNVIPIRHLDIAREHLNAPRLDITTFHDGEYGLEKANHRKACIHHITEFIERYASPIQKEYNFA